MIKLEKIQKDIQNIAEAISSVLNIDVTIVDKQFVRIAGTGKYKNKIGEKITAVSAFGKTLDGGESFIIENPRHDDVCMVCGNRDACNEYAEVCTPIKLENDIYAVIGLIAFNERQRKSISENKHKLIDFLNKMADLMSDKIKAELRATKLKIEAKRLDMLLNNIDKAVLSMDYNFVIDKYNDKLKDIFKFDYEIEGKNIFEVFSFIKKEDIKFSNNSNSFEYIKNEYKFKGIYHSNPITIDDEISGYVIDFVDNYSTIKDFNKIANFYHNVNFDNIIGNSQQLNSVKKKSMVASKSASTVLIVGESGTGKELFARAIHNNSQRGKNPFIAINCAAIPDNLLESELFGYEEGAFTGAKKGGKLGKFELANKGTIFLDEIGDMSLHLQAKLLRVLQEKEVNKLGSKSNITLDVRIIAATNKDLEQMVEEGEFREDLFYRLNVLPINIPALRERKEDVELLVRMMITNYSNKLNKEVTDIEKSAMKVLMEFSWPGNVRQLQNVIEYSVNMATEKIILFEDLPEKLKEKPTKKVKEDLVQSEIIPFWELEKNEILKAMDKYKDYKKDKDKIANELGISRATLYRKIKEYGLK